ncbi:MAG: transketolase family protein [Candidatus Liptonbacteria bacterium]|nr:transketolase family protein [Candidatus Liptonbacteria bacterium]
MLNLDLHLNPKLFDPGVAQKPTRDGYGNGLVAAASENPNVVALTADLKESTRVEEFAQKFPERFFECGVAEQNMVTVAAGLGVSGKIPFISSYATFSPGRNWEQIRTTVCYNNSNVKIAGHHAGISVGPDGVTHQATEDVAIMRVLPNLTVIVPCDAVEAEKATKAAAQIWGPVYLRFTREKTPILTTADTPFRPGKAELFWTAAKPRVLVIASGPILYQALLTARELEQEKIPVLVLNCHTIKPLDEQQIITLAKKTGAVVTAEEHQAAGGLGGAITELLAHKLPVPVARVGLADCFAESGPPAQLFAKYGLDASSIKSAVKRILRQRNHDF